MQEKFKNSLLAVLVVSTLILGSSSVFELFQINSLNSEVNQLKSTISNTLITTSTSTILLFTTSTISITTSIPFPAEEGVIQFKENIPYWKGYSVSFSYKRVADLSPGSSITFKNVTFYSVPSTESTTGCSLREIRVTFLDGIQTTVNLGYCMKRAIPTIVYVNNSKQKAGIIYAPRSEYEVGVGMLASPIGQGVYLLVEEIPVTTTTTTSKLFLVKPSYDGKYFLYIEISDVNMESLNEIFVELYDPGGVYIGHDSPSESGKVTFYIEYAMKGNYSVLIYGKGDYVQKEEFPLITGT
jgi:hypothetical protein